MFILGLNYLIVISRETAIASITALRHYNKILDMDLEKYRGLKGYQSHINSI